MHLARMIPFLCLLQFAASAATAQDATPAGLPPVVITPVISSSTTAAGQPITLPQKDVEVAVSIYDIAPGAKLAVHQHPYPRYAYVLAGTLQVTDADSGASTTYKAGDFVIEMIGKWHQGANIGADPVKLLVIDQFERGATQTVVRQ